jgi:hypothetical protein
MTGILEKVVEGTEGDDNMEVGSSSISIYFSISFR